MGSCLSNLRCDLWMYNDPLWYSPPTADFRTYTTIDSRDPITQAAAILDPGVELFWLEFNSRRKRKQWSNVRLLTLEVYCFLSFLFFKNGKCKSCVSFGYYLLCITVGLSAAKHCWNFKNNNQFSIRASFTILLFVLLVDTDKRFTVLVSTYLDAHILIIPVMVT